MRTTRRRRVRPASRRVRPPVISGSGRSAISSRIAVRPVASASRNLANSSASSLITNSSRVVGSGSLTDGVACPIVACIDATASRPTAATSMSVAVLSEIAIMRVASSCTVRAVPGSSSWVTPDGRLASSGVNTSSASHARSPATIASATAPSTYSLNTDAIGPIASGSAASRVAHDPSDTSASRTRAVPSSASRPTASSNVSGTSSRRGGAVGCRNRVSMRPAVGSTPICNRSSGASAVGAIRNDPDRSSACSPATTAHPVAPPVTCGSRPTKSSYPT